MKLFTLVLISTFFFTGCVANLGSRSPYADFVLLEIKRPITVPAGSSFAYVKARGQVVRRKEIGTYELYCKFLVPRPKNSGETVINPDNFTIHGIHKRFADVLPINFGEYQVAFNGRVRPHHGNGGTQVDLELYFKISSENQPQVKSLSCIRFGDPVFYNMPKVKEVQELFGDLAEFKTRE